ncbi:MAG: DUF4097 family beta strand repeat protein [Blastocatellia bacterium]|nr:DUF4097 family beta strand repeat protein [Blastocatellia bacterium]
MKFKVVIISFLLVLPASVAYADGHGGKSGTQKIERSIAALPTVAVSICVDSGDVTVRGWDKNEVLARSSEVGRIELKRPDAGNQSAAANKVLVWLADKSEEPNEKGGCHAFGDVELIVPRGASLYLQTGDGTIDVRGVASVFARSETGDISIQKASRSVEALSFSGEISVENSTGRMAMKSVSGVVSAANLRPNDQNDCFEASTISGDIQLDGVDHQQITLKTANGKIDLSGPLAHQGRYTFNTTSGDVTLSLPANSSFRLNARVARDREVTSDFPLTLTIEDPVPVLPRLPNPAPPAPPAPAPRTIVKANPEAKDQVVVVIDPQEKTIKVKPVTVKTLYSLRRISAVHGSGDALITIASFTGTIHLIDSGN